MDTIWVIFSNGESLLQEEAMYWSNKDGWGALAEADLFTNHEMFVISEGLNLPVGGAWMPEDYARCVNKHWEDITKSEQTITVEFLWEKLGDVPVNDDGILLDSFLGFPTGTHRETVWHWFEEFFEDTYVHYLMFPKEKP